MESIPQRPEGNTPEANFMKWVWDCCARRLRLRSVPNQYDVNYDDLKGVFLGIKIRPGGKPAPSTPSDYKLMAITQLGSSLVPANYDLLICQEWDANTNAIKAGTSSVYVAKTIEARRTITAEYFFDNGDNIVQTYTYFAPTSSDASYGDNFRLATDGGLTPNELQVMERRYYSKAMLPLTAGAPPVSIGFKQCLIYVVDTNIPTGVKDPTGADVTRIEVKPFRTWGRYATQ